MEPTIICRCCGLSFFSHKDLFTEYLEDDIKVVYSEILMNTFNILMSQQENNDICEDCVRKMTEATKFKSLVVITENTLIKTINCMKTEVSQNKLEGIKTENEYQEELYNDDWSDDTSQIHEDDSPTRKRMKAIRKTKTDIPIGKSNETNENLISINEKSDNEIYLRDTSLKLIQNSNMCLFVSQKTKFKCFYCNHSYITMKKLREHTNIHKNETHLNNVFKHIRQFSTRNVDITNLGCNLCRIPCDTLEDLRTHLSTSHAVKFDSSDHLLVPYKLTVTDGYSCAMCDEKFNTFHCLNIHMNSHSLANVCEVCGMSFWNRIKLRMHIYSQHKRKKCNICSETFKTASLKTKHMRRTHQMGVSRRICPECGQIFSYDHQLTDHRTKMHNLKRKIFKCVECPKEFKLACNLYKHVRGVHRGEKRFSCELCNMSFFYKSDKKRHGSSHNSEKLFSCNYCNCKFKRKDAWRRHLKKQHGNIINDEEIKL